MSITILSSTALPEYLEGNTPKKKRPFLFQKKSGARKSGKQRAFFFGVRRVCEAVAGHSFRLFPFVQNSSE